MEKYIKAVNKHFNLDIRENTRKFEYVVARAWYYKICREVGGYTYHRIAKSVNKTHATVLHSLAELPNIIKYDYNIGNKCKDLFSNYDFCYNITDNNRLIEIFHKFIKPKHIYVNKI